MFKPFRELLIIVVDNMESKILIFTDVMRKYPCIIISRANTP